MFARELNTNEVAQAISNRQSGNVSSESSTGARFLRAIDAVSRAVPHTNEAAKRGRRHGEAMQHQFGLSHVFLTVTPDDDNSFIIQAFAGVEIDDDTPISNCPRKCLRKGQV